MAGAQQVMAGAQQAEDLRSMP